jgi:hypothetical protein
MKQRGLSGAGGRSEYSPGCLSQWHCFPQDSIPDASLQAPLGNDIDRATQEISKILQQPPQVEQAPAAPHVDQEVDVTPVIRFVTRYGAEDPNVGGTMKPSQSENLGPPPAQLFDSHAYSSHARYG